jgi:prepilin-type N-terminal cleavage/methylation domain-containing protein
LHFRSYEFHELYHIDEKEDFMKNNRDGFSMIEVMAGMLVLSFLVLTTDAYMVSLIKTNTTAKEISQATFIGNTGMEKLKGTPFADLASGSDTVQNKFLRSWNVVPNGNMDKITLSVEWPLVTIGGKSRHHIQVSTIIAQ